MRTLRNPFFCLLAATTLNTTPVNAEESWQASFGAGTMPSCIFSDSGLGTNESILGRVYCHYAFSMTLRIPFRDLFVRGGRSLLSASDSESEGDNVRRGFEQTVYLNSIVVGHEISFESFSGVLGLGAGGFSGVGNERHSILADDGSHEVEKTSYDLNGLALYGHFRLPIIRFESQMIDLNVYIYQFQTKATTPDHPKFDMTALPSAEFAWGMRW